MSQEPYPETDRTAPGSTPAEAPGGQAELERQRAAAETLPGQSTRDPLREEDETGEDETGKDQEGTYEPVPPEHSVPDEVAEEAARSLDARTASRDRDRDPGDDPMRTFPSTGDTHRPPSDNA